MSSGFSEDCSFYDSRNQRVRPYCVKLTKEIRVRDCRDCGWYTTPGSNMLPLGDGTCNGLELEVEGEVLNDGKE